MQADEREEWLNGFASKPERCPPYSLADAMAIAKEMLLEPVAWRIDDADGRLFEFTANKARAAHLGNQRFRVTPLYEGKQ